LPVKIGTFETTLHLFETTAPEAYDGFDTFTLATAHTKAGPVRLVAISKRNLEWQTGRYASGLHTPRPFDGEGDYFWGYGPGEITDTLLDRIYGRMQK